MEENNIDEDRMVKIMKEDGEEVEAEVLFSFEEAGDEFIVYQIDEEAFAAKILEDDTLVPVEEDEWKIIEPMFNEWMEDNVDD